MSRRPNLSSAAAIILRMSFSLATSVWMGTAAAPMAAATASCLPLISAQMTLAPSEANSAAMARPMPDPAPVMTATLFSSRINCFPGDNGIFSPSSESRDTLDDGRHPRLAAIEQAFFILHDGIRHFAGAQIGHGVAKDLLIIETQFRDDIECQLFRSAGIRIRMRGK